MKVSTVVEATSGRRALSPQGVKATGELPEGWRMLTVAEVGADNELPVLTGPFGTNLTRSDFTEKGVPVLTISCLTQHGIRLDKAQFVSAAKANEMKRYQLESGDLLFSRMASVGRAGIIGEALRGALFNYHIMRLRLNPLKISAQFFTYFVQGAKQVRDYLLAVNHGATRDGINTSQLLAMPVLVPPFEEQKRIVAEIERQFTRLDAGVTALRRVQANLKRYRAAILKAACEGRLVPIEAELGRKGNRKGKFESGEALLARILTERRQNWQGRGKYKDSASPDVTNLPPLPDGWMWASIEQLLREPLCNGVSIKGSDDPPGIRALRLSAMSNAGFDYSDSRYLPLAESDVDDLWIEEGDFFMSRGNGSLHLVGRGTSAQKPPEPTIFPDTMIRLRFADPIRKSGWVRTLWSSQMVRSQIEARVKTTAGIYKIAQPQVEGMIIPIPPLTEQARIVAEVERRLSVVGELEAVVSANLQRATRLRQSILHRAFSGQLVSAVPCLAVVGADPYVPSVTVSIPFNSPGIYTLPDAARLLQLPLPRLRSWVRGSVISDEDGGAAARHLPAGKLSHQGEGLGRNFGFLTLIELFTIGQLRECGVTMKTLREARDELEKRYNTSYPFALKGILTDGKSILYNLGEAALLELGKNGQTAFEKVLDQFCHRLEFDDITKLVTRFYPAGRKSAVVVDPRHQFGKPIIAGTSVATESIASRIRGGDRMEDVAADLVLTPEQVADAWNFENREAA